MIFLIGITYLITIHVRSGYFSNIDDAIKIMVALGKISQKNPLLIVTYIVLVIRIYNIVIEVSFSEHIILKL